MKLVVTLTPEQERWTRAIAAQRVEQAKGNPKWAYTDERGALATHTIGCMGELAFCIAMDLEWPARVSTYRKLPDVDPFWEVRWSGHPKNVKVATNDKPDQIVAMVIGEIPTFRMIGFVEANWAQKNVPLTDPGNRGVPAHFVDVYQLTPFTEDFHTNHAWFNHPEKGWICAHCPRTYEGPVPGTPVPERVQPDLQDAKGRPEGQPDAT